jgi:hypothetical protein
LLYGVRILLVHEGVLCAAPPGTHPCKVAANLTRAHDDTDPSQFLAQLDRRPCPWTSKEVVEGLLHDVLVGFVGSRTREPTLQRGEPVRPERAENPPYRSRRAAQMTANPGRRPALRSQEDHLDAISHPPRYVRATTPVA